MLQLFNFKIIHLFIFGCAWVFVAMCGLSLVVVRGLLVVVASLVAEHGLSGAWASVVMLLGLVFLWHRESSQSRDRTVSPALAGRFLTTGPSEQSSVKLYRNRWWVIVCQSLFCI